jgi:hypothetical protein
MWESPSLYFGRTLNRADHCDAGLHGLQPGFGIGELAVLNVRPQCCVTGLGNGADGAAEKQHRREK